MGFLRFLSLFLKGVALMLLGADVVTSLENGGVSIRSMLDVLGLFGSDASVWFQTILPISASGPVIMVLGLPGWALTEIGRAHV